MRIVGDHAKANFGRDDQSRGGIDPQSPDSDCWGSCKGELWPRRPIAWRHRSSKPRFGLDVGALTSESDGQC
ncbi:hypothetical protein QE152_g6267 [Popillia japonica]|uniref:Uncharacterized protein n=1 Tax=Popillia japonica TaxID=7064 RepID=A0AAW1MJG6_POPJA